MSGSNYEKEIRNALDQVTYKHGNPILKTSDPNINYNNTLAEIAAINPTLRAMGPTEGPASKLAPENMKSNISAVEVVLRNPAFREEILRQLGFGDTVPPPAKGDLVP